MKCILIPGSGLFLPGSPTDKRRQRNQQWASPCRPALKRFPCWRRNRTLPGDGGPVRGRGGGNRGPRSAGWECKSAALHRSGLVSFSPPLIVQIQFFRSGACLQGSAFILARIRILLSLKIFKLISFRYLT